ncbi:hypothetical protein F5148DRAFT_123125 [Russula earlei]|uniref:Uncharacterized protein n=1 Tax=Russula earlei TaxID=71964 RepID=A0ACC0UKC6_9AGAM|nr:hypothetical protein F5148DRAFT_123125 [Russula earlei]
MHFIDVLTLCLSFLGVYGLVLYLRFLLPRNVVPCVAAALSEAQQLLDRAEYMGAIPRLSEYRSALADHEHQFMRMRRESHRSATILGQLLLALRSGLTYKLYALSLRIDAMKVNIELAMDERQLSTQNLPTIALPNSAASKHLTCLECHQEHSLFVLPQLQRSRRTTSQSYKTAR